MERKLWPQDVLKECAHGVQRCQVCERVECGDNIWIRQVVMSVSCPYTKGSYITHKGNSYYIQEVSVKQVADEWWFWKLLTIIQ